MGERTKSRAKLVKDIWLASSLLSTSPDSNIFLMECQKQGKPLDGSVQLLSGQTVVEGVLREIVNWGRENTLGNTNLIPIEQATIWQKPRSWHRTGAARQCRSWRRLLWHNLQVVRSHFKLFKCFVTLRTGCQKSRTTLKVYQCTGNILELHGCWVKLRGNKGATKKIHLTQKLTFLL